MRLAWDRLVIAISLLGNFVVLSELLFVQLIYRHGERNPLHTYPNDPYQSEAWPNGFGQLSTLGCQQQYELGQYLRSRYCHFLSNNYIASEIYVRSTDTDRTLSSAACNQAGLYEPSGDQVWNKSILWQPIPIHTIPYKKEYLFKWMGECPALKRAFEMTEHEVKWVNDTYAELFDFLAPLTGFDPFGWKDVEHVADPLFRKEKFGYPLPEWSTEKWLDYESGDDMMIKDILYKLYDKLFEYRMVPVEKAKLIGGMLNGIVLNNIREKISGRIPYPSKMYVFSGHDTMLLTYMYGMGIDYGKIPPAASCLMIELHRNNDAQYSVEIYLRNSTQHEPYLLSAPNCDLDGCTLQQYLQIASPIALYPEEKWTKECEK